MTLLASFDPSAWYAWLVYIATAYLLWSSVFEKGHRHLRWLWDKAHPSPPEPVSGVQEPDVVLGHPGGSLSTTPLSDIPEGGHGELTRVEPRYLIENKDAALGIRDVTTGVRTRDGRNHVFSAFYAGLIAARSEAQVENVGSIPQDLLEGVHESAAFSTSFSGPALPVKACDGRSSTTRNRGETRISRFQCLDPNLGPESVNANATATP